MPEARLDHRIPQILTRILVANDGSRGARKALHVAIHRAKLHEVELHQITVKERLPRYIEDHGVCVGQGRVLHTQQEAADYFHHVSTEASVAARAEGVKLIPHVVHGDVVEEITRIVREQGFGLLVIGYNGHSAMFGHNLGSSSRKLAALSPCSVLVAK